MPTEQNIQRKKQNPTSRFFGKEEISMEFEGCLLKADTMRSIRSSVCLSFDALPICAEEFKVETNPSSRYFGDLKVLSARDVLVSEIEINLN